MQNIASNTQQNRATYSVAELATELGISRQSVYLALGRGEIPAIRLKRRYLLPRLAIEEWLRTAAGKLA